MSNVLRIITVDLDLEINFQVIDNLLIEGFYHSYHKNPKNQLKYLFTDFTDVSILIYEEKNFTYINTFTISAKNKNKVISAKTYLRKLKLKKLL